MNSLFKILSICSLDLVLHHLDADKHIFKKLLKDLQEIHTRFKCQVLRELRNMRNCF